MRKFLMLLLLLALGCTNVSQPSPAQFVRNLKSVNGSTVRKYAPNEIHGYILSDKVDPKVWNRLLQEIQAYLKREGINIKDYKLEARPKLNIIPTLNASLKDRMFHTGDVFLVKSGDDLIFVLITEIRLKGAVVMPVVFRLKRGENIRLKEIEG